MAIFDCTMFFNENDLLEIRLNEHWEFIDKFIIVEAKETHTGIYKDLNFDHNRFKSYMSKIEYVVIDNFKDAMNQYPTINCLIGRNIHGHHQDWARDHFQFNYITKVLKDIGADQRDLVYFSCLDEILKKTSFARSLDFFNTNKDKYRAYNWTNNQTIGIDFDACINYNLYMYAYKFNLMRFSSSQGYVAGAMTTVRNLMKLMPATMRASAIITHPHMKDAGWHFSYIDSGNGEAIVKKYKSWAHANDVYPDGSKRSDIIDPKQALNFLLKEFGMNIPNSMVPIQKETHPDYLVDNQDLFDSMIYKHN